MIQKLIPKNYRLLIFIIVLLSFVNQSKAQVEFKLNPPAALWGVFQTGFEFPINAELSFEPEIIFFAVDGNVGGGLIIHGKYYFNPDYGSDKVYAGMMAGAFGDNGSQFLGFGFEAGYKWIGARNIIFEIGGGIGRITGEESGVGPYGRLMVGYRFPKKEKK